MCFEIIGKASGKIWQIKPFHGFFYRIITNVCRTPFSWSTSINGVRNGIVSNDILSTQLSMMVSNILHKSLCYLQGKIKCQWLNWIWKWSLYFYFGLIRNDENNLFMHNMTISQKNNFDEKWFKNWKSSGINIELNNFVMAYLIVVLSM